MQNIAFYLQKYSKIGFKEEGLKKCLIESVREVCDIEVSMKQIKISNDSIHINVTGVFKSEIFLNKGKINTVFSEKLEKSGKKVASKKLI